MTPDDRGLLDAIIAVPDDDTPRLVYADWLDEHGRAERAEFIRLQCVLAASYRDPTLRADGIRAANQLDDLCLRAPRADLWGEVAGLPGVTCREWERGFPCKVSGTRARRNLPRCLASSPWHRSPT